MNKHIFLDKLVKNPCGLNTIILKIFVICLNKLICCQLINLNVCLSM